MTLQHLELLSVLKADNIVRLDRRADRHCRFLLLHFGFRLRATQIGKRAVNVGNEQRKIRHCHAIVADMCGNNIRSERDQRFLQVILRVHFRPFT